MTSRTFTDQQIKITENMFLVCDIERRYESIEDLLYEMNADQSVAKYDLPVPEWVGCLRENKHIQKEMQVILIRDD